MKVFKKTALVACTAMAAMLIPGITASATTEEGLYSTFYSIYGDGASNVANTVNNLASEYNLQEYVPDITSGSESAGSTGSSSGGAAINGRPVITYYPIGHEATVPVTPQAGGSSGYPTGSASMEVDGDSYSVQISNGQIQLTTDDNTYAQAMPTSGSVGFDTNYEYVTITIYDTNFTMEIDGNTATGALVRPATTALQGSASNTQKTFVKDIGPLESDPIGPRVNTVSLSETYHENYKVYEERLDDVYAIYTNIPAGTITNKPVIFDIPSGVVLRLTKDGKEIGYKNKSKLSSEGTYVAYFYVASDSIEQLPAWAQTLDRAMFTFRIQLTALDGSSLEVPETSELESFADVVNEGEQPQTEGEPAEQTGEEVTEEPATEEATEPAEEPVEEPAEEPVAEPAAEGIEPNSGGIYTEYDPSTGYYKNTLMTGDVFYSSIPNGMITNGSALFNTAENIRYELYKDGELIDYTAGEHITDAGDYMMVPVIDNLDYEGFYRTERPSIRFHILTGATNKMAVVSVPFGQTIDAVRFNGEEITENAKISDGVVSLPEDGIYEVDFIGEAGSVTTEIYRDCTPPILKVDTQPNLAAITYMSDDIAAAVLKRGEEIISEDQLPTRVTQAGRYQLTVTDRAGNTTDVNFSVQYRINVYAILAIVMIIAIIGAVVIFLRRVKTKVRVR
ncbi:hypothetical protein [Butyrivibrio sp. WCD3002]|uniref:hypothetical protein n=1 Tax=Butyrivibrio sp. WCD3002 TaxID=1280676 RepID=UPI0003FE5AC9|nr:hypothetical protein [Butyrivibrio sp. WCD3002]